MLYRVSVDGVLEQYDIAPDQSGMMLDCNRVINVATGEVVAAYTAQLWATESQAITDHRRGLQESVYDEMRALVEAMQLVERAKEALEVCQRDLDLFDSRHPVFT